MDSTEGTPKQNDKPCSPQTSHQIVDRARVLNIHGYDESLAFNRRFIENDGWVPIYSVGLDNLNAVPKAKFMDVVTEIEKPLIPFEQGKPTPGYVDMISKNTTSKGALAEISYTTSEYKVSFYPHGESEMIKIIRVTGDSGQLLDEKILTATETEGKAILLDLILITQKAGLL